VSAECIIRRFLLEEVDRASETSGIAPKHTRFCHPLTLNGHEKKWNVIWTAERHKLIPYRWLHAKEIFVESHFVKANSGHIMRRALRARKSRRRLRAHAMLIWNWIVFNSPSRCWSHNLKSFAFTQSCFIFLKRNLLLPNVIRASSVMESLRSTSLSYQGHIVSNPPRKVKGTIFCVV
jgi:hypothetical protein